MEHIHRRIGSPVVTDLTITGDGLTLLDDTRSPGRLPGLYPGVPLVVSGRYAAPSLHAAAGVLTVTGRTRDDQPFTATVPVQRREEPAVTAQWARARLRDLEDRYAAGDHDLEQSIVTTSLRFGVLCRFTAYVAVDSRVVNEDGETRRVTQPVELPSGWELPGADPAMPMMLASAAPPPPLPVAGSMPQPFAPVRASMPRGTARSPGSRAPKTFAAIPSSVQAGGRLARAAAPTSSGLTLDDVRRLAALEATRLRDAATRPAPDRRDFLDDLTSRLSVLLDGLTDAEYAPLHALVTHLTAGTGDLDARWAEATAVLESFGADAPRPAMDPSGDVKPERKAFWKR
jgi:Ca-activated chloride channel family protein